MNMTRLLSVGRVIGRVAEIGVNHIYDATGNVIETLERKDRAVFCFPHDNDKVIGKLFRAAACINVRGIFAGIAQLV